MASGEAQEVMALLFELLEARNYLLCLYLTQVTWVGKTCVYRALRSAVPEGPPQARPHPTATLARTASELPGVSALELRAHEEAVCRLPQGRSARRPVAGWGPITAQDIQHDTGDTSVHRSSEPLRSAMHGCTASQVTHPPSPTLAYLF